MPIIYKVGLLVAVFLVLLYAFQGFYPDFIYFFSNASPPVIAGAAVVTSGIALERYWRKARGEFPRAWLYFTLGLFFWFVGEAVWAGYTLVLGVELPYPSIADVFWMVGYFPLFMGLFSYIKLFRDAITWKKLAATLAVTVVFTSVSMSLLVPLIFGAKEDLAIKILNFAYPVMDLVLFAVAHLGLLIFWKGKIGKSWLLISLAIATATCADVFFSYATFKGVYYSGHMDALYDIAYLLFIMAFYVHAKEL